MRKRTSWLVSVIPTLGMVGTILAARGVPLAHAQPGAPAPSSSAPASPPTSPAASNGSPPSPVPPSPDSPPTTATPVGTPALSPSAADSAWLAARVPVFPPPPTSPETSPSTSALSTPAAPAPSSATLPVQPREDPRRLGGGFARTAALGGGAATHARDENPFLQDVTYVITNPAYASVYGDFVWGNIGQPRDADASRVGNLGELTMVGAHFRLSPAVVAGLIVGAKDAIFFEQRPSAEFTKINPNFPANTFVNPLLQSRLGEGTNLTRDRSIANTMGILLALDLSSRVRLGGQLYGGLLSSSIEQKTEDPSTAASQREKRSAATLGGNVGAVIEAGRSTIELSTKMRFNSASRALSSEAGGVTSSVTEKASTSPEMGFDARAFLPVNRRVTVVPLLRFKTFSWSPKRSVEGPQPAGPASTSAITYQAHDLEIGVGANLHLPHALLVGGMSVQWLRDSVSSHGTTGSGEDKQGTTLEQSLVVLDLPKLHLGAEFYPHRVLTFRIGYFRRNVVASYKDKQTVSLGVDTASNERHINDTGVPFGRLSTGGLVSVGLGIHFAGVALEIAVAVPDRPGDADLWTHMAASYLF